MQINPACFALGERVPLPYTDPRWTDANVTYTSHNRNGVARKGRPSQPQNLLRSLR
jgi:hypothetical protein